MSTSTTPSGRPAPANMSAEATSAEISAVGVFGRVEIDAARGTVNGWDNADASAVSGLV